MIKVKMMKKQLIICLMLLLASAAQTQSTLKVVPVMKKGEVRSYVSETINNTAGNNIKITQQTDYTIVEVTDSGYVVDLVCTSINTEADVDNITKKLLSLNESMMQNAHIRLATDKEGKPIKILNYEEVRQNTENVLNKIVNEILAELPDMGNLISKEAMLEKARTQMDEEKILSGIQKSASPLALNGKMLNNTTEEDYVNAIGLKMKRRYTVNGNSVIAKSVMNMDKSDLKQLILAQMKAAIPSMKETEILDIDMLMDSGMLTFQMDEEATYELLDNGWVKSIKTITNNKMMGQSSSITCTVTLK